MANPANRKELAILEKDSLLAELRTRTVRETRNLHILARESDYWCLDLNRGFASLAEFKQQIGDILDGLGDSILPTAPDTDWDELLQPGTERAERLVLPRHLAGGGWLTATVHRRQS